MTPLPDAARRVYEGLARYIKREGESPRYEDLAEELQMSVGGVQRQMRNLRQWKYVGKRQGARGFYLIKDATGRDLRRRPLVKGTGRAGVPSLAVESYDGIDPIADLLRRFPQARAVQLDMPIQGRKLKPRDWIFVERREPIGDEWKYEDGAVVAVLMWLS